MDPGFGRIVSASCSCSQSFQRNSCPPLTNREKCDKVDNRRHHEHKDERSKQTNTNKAQGRRVFTDRSGCRCLHIVTLPWAFSFFCKYPKISLDKMVINMLQYTHRRKQNDLAEEDKLTNKQRLADRGNLRGNKGILLHCSEMGKRRK